jgi:predicted transposase YdaD
MTKDDTLWKSLLEDIFDDLLRYLYPDANEIFDMERGFDFLDKELADLFPELNEQHIRFVDKLVKVWLKNGKVRWILIHIEVQGRYDKRFAERMFIYFYRIRDKYHRDIVAWAILTDTNKKFVPTEYKESFLGTSVSYEFNMLKAINQNEKTLQESNNPFSIVMLTVLLALKKKRVDEIKLVDLKMDIVKHLYRKEIPKKKIQAVMNFLKHYVRFNEENTLIFDKKLDSFTGKSYPMGIEQFLLQRAKKEGVIEGELKGIEKGIQEGVDIQLKETIKNARLENMSIESIARIVKLLPERVRQILDDMGIE